MAISTLPLLLVAFPSLSSFKIKKTERKKKRLLLTPDNVFMNHPALFQIYKPKIMYSYGKQGGSAAEKQ